MIETMTKCFKLQNYSHLFSSLFSVNSAFHTLRLLIPTEPKNRKLSKIETLRLAKSYISHLGATLLAGKTFVYDIWKVTLTLNKVLFNPKR